MSATAARERSAGTGGRKEEDAVSQVIPPSRSGADTNPWCDRDESTPPAVCCARLVPNVGGGRRARGRSQSPERTREKGHGKRESGAAGASPESVEEAFHAAGGLVLQHLDAAFHLGVEEGDC